MLRPSKMGLLIQTVPLGRFEIKQFSPQMKSAAGSEHRSLFSRESYVGANPGWTHANLSYRALLLSCRPRTATMPPVAEHRSSPKTYWGRRSTLRPPIRKRQIWYGIASRTGGDC